MSPLLYEQHGAVALITLNRPQSLNALEATLLKALFEALTVAAEDTNIRAVVITGAGRGFCAGADLVAAMPKKQINDQQESQSNNATTPAKVIGDGLRAGYHPIIELIRAMPKPVITAVNGPAAGAGMSIALAGDIVLAARSATFTQAFANIGLIPDAGSTYFLPRAIGLIRARALAMLGQPVTAQDALNMGLVWQVLDDTNFIDEVMALATKMAARPTKAHALIKQALNQSLNNNLTEQLELEAQLQSQAGATEDFYEGVSAFLQKRPPKFQGK